MTSATSFLADEKIRSLTHSLEVKKVQKSLTDVNISNWHNEKYLTSINCAAPSF